MTDFLAALKRLSDGGQLLTYEMNNPATVVLDSRTISGRVIRMSPGTALFVGSLAVPAGTLLELRIEGFDRPMRARFVDADADGVHLQLPLGHAQLQLHRPDAGATGPEVRRLSACQSPWIDPTDPGLTNLVVNAAQATKSTATITVGSTVTLCLPIVAVGRAD